MGGTFSSVGTALSALRYNQVALDIAAQNLSNATTDGYVRRRVAGEAVGGPEVPALWSRYEGHGDGVRVASAQRMVDPLLDARMRREHGTLSYLQTAQTVLVRVENGVNEPGDDGVSGALLEFRKAWHDLANNPGSDAARQQVVSQGVTLAEALGAQVTNIEGEEADQRLHLLSVVGEVNTAAVDLAALNQTIMSMELNGTDVGTLHDKRDQLALGLAELIGGAVIVRSDGMFDVSVGGQPLVRGDEAGALAITGGVTSAGDADGSPISFAVTGSWGTTPLPGSLSGEFGAVTDLLSSTLPSYRAGLDQIAVDLATSINAQHGAGFDLAGDPGQPFFAFEPPGPAGAAASLRVALANPDQVAAASIAGTLDGSNADALSSAGLVDGAYQQLVNSFGTDVAVLNRRTANQASLTGSIDAAWEQQAGVNLDEETVAMMTAQRAYEAAARLMTTLDQIMDTLINRTGLVGR